MNSKRSGKRSRRSHGYRRSNLPLPAQEEWDFSTCPEAELFSCWIYEFKREIPEVIDRVEEWRQKSPTRTFESFRALPGRPSVCSPISTYYCFPEWPSRPYLSIGKVERNNRYKKFYPKSSYEYEAGALKPDLPDIFDRSLLTEVLRSDGYHTAPDIPGLPDTALLALLQIDLSFPDQTLVERFRALLRVFRQRFKVSEEPLPKGKASPVSKAKALLRGLGAYRLRQKYKMSAADVISSTKTISGRAIYSDEAHLSRAVKRAKRLIESSRSELIRRSGRSCP